MFLVLALHAAYAAALEAEAAPETPVNEADNKSLKVGCQGPYAACGWGPFSKSCCSGKCVKNACGHGPFGSCCQPSEAEAAPKTPVKEAGEAAPETPVNEADNESLKVGC